MPCQTDGNVIPFPGTDVSDDVESCPTGGDGGGMCYLEQQTLVSNIPFNDPITADYPIPGLKEWRCVVFLQGVQ